MSKSDPIVIVDMMDKSAIFTRLGATEWIQNELNPEFKTELEMDYIFEKKQHLRITVLDVDDPDSLPQEYTPNVSKICDICLLVRKYDCSLESFSIP